MSFSFSPMMSSPSSSSVCSGFWTHCSNGCNDTGLDSDDDDEDVECDKGSSLPDNWDVLGLGQAMHTRGGWGTDFIPIAEYGKEFCKGSRQRKPRKVVKLLYSGNNHYDLLV